MCRPAFEQSRNVPPTLSSMRSHALPRRGTAHRPEPSAQVPGVPRRIARPSGRDSSSHPPGRPQPRWHGSKSYEDPPWLPFPQGPPGRPEFTTQHRLRLTRRCSGLATAVASLPSPRAAELHFVRRPTRCSYVTARASFDRHSTLAHAKLKSHDDLHTKRW